MRIARYKKSSPGQPERVKYSITEIAPEEWHEIVVAMGGLYSGLAIEMHKQMQAVDQAHDIDADGGGKWSE